MFQDKVVVITGGAGGIRKCIREEFEKTGAKVCVNICIDGGMTKLMICHDHWGWTYQP